MLRSKISKYAKGAPSLRPTFCVWKKSCSVVPSGSTETFFRTPKDKRSLPYEWSSGHLYQEKHPEQPGGLAPVASQTNLIGFAWRNSNMAVCHWNWKLLFCRRTTAVQWLDWTYHISVIQPPLAPSCAMRQCDISPAFLTPQGAAPTWFHRNPQGSPGGKIHIHILSWEWLVEICHHWPSEGHEQSGPNRSIKSAASPNRQFLFEKALGAQRLGPKMASGPQFSVRILYTAGEPTCHASGAASLGTQIVHPPSAPCLKALGRLTKSFLSNGRNENKKKVDTPETKLSNKYTWK